MVKNPHYTNKNMSKKSTFPFFALFGGKKMTKSQPKTCFQKLNRKKCFSTAVDDVTHNEMWLMLYICHFVKGRWKTRESETADVQALMSCDSLSCLCVWLCSFLCFLRVVELALRFRPITFVLPVISNGWNASATVWLWEHARTAPPTSWTWRCCAWWWSYTRRNGLCSSTNRWNIGDSATFGSVPYGYS